jgi:deoxyadenosine/deoxycytidine kinase
MQALEGTTMSAATLVVVSGPLGTGKTTLAHMLAAALGCPAICRVSIDAPYLEVDTTDGYRPALEEIVAFVDSHGQGC